MMEKDQHTSSGPSFFGFKEMLSYSLAAATTMVYSWFAIGRRFGTNSKDITDRRGVEALHVIRENFDKQEDGLLNREQKGWRLAREMGKLNGEQSRLEAQFWKNKGMRSTVHKLASLKPHQKLEVLFASIGIFSVSLGAILSATRSKEFAHLFHLKDSASDHSRG